MNQYFEARRAEAVRLLAEKGVPRWRVVPAFYRFVWSLGIRLRPPHFASWEANFALFGGGAAATTAVISCLVMMVMDGEIPLVQTVVMSVGFLIVFGFIQAARHKREAEDHGLPPWGDLPDVVGVFD